MATTEKPPTDALHGLLGVCMGVVIATRYPVPAAARAAAAAVVAVVGVWQIARGLAWCVRSLPRYRIRITKVDA
jgi:hypothetical protein